MAIDWPKIRNDYINGGGSYRALAEKYGVSEQSIGLRGRTENWVQLKNEQLGKISTKLAQKTSDVIVEHEVNRTEKILELTDSLVDKIEMAITELDIATVKNKRKTKVIEYNNEDAPFKPTKEVIEENEEILEMFSVIDRLGLQQVANALKIVSEIQTDIAKDGKESTDIEDLTPLAALLNRNDKDTNNTMG